MIWFASLSASAIVLSAVRWASSSVRLIVSASSAATAPGAAGGSGVGSRGARRRLLLELLQAGDGGTSPSLHRRRLLGRVLQRLGRGGTKRFDLALVVAAALDGGELPGADVVRADRHR